MVMKRIFITNMSLQGRGDLGRVFYNPKGFTLTENRKTRFPIIPIIFENLKEEDPIKIIVLRTVNGDTEDNLSRFYDELNDDEKIEISKYSEDIGLPYEFIKFSKSTV